MITNILDSTIEVGAVPSEANKSNPIPPFRFILGMVGVITALIEITRITGFFTAVGIVAFFVLIYLGLAAVTTSRVIRT